MSVCAGERTIPGSVRIKDKSRARAGNSPINTKIVRTPSLNLAPPSTVCLRGRGPCAAPRVRIQSTLTAFLLPLDEGAARAGERDGRRDEGEAAARACAPLRRRGFAGAAAGAASRAVARRWRRSAAPS